MLATVIFMVLLFYFLQFLPDFDSSFRSCYCSLPPRAMKVNAIKKWLLDRRIGVSTAVLGRAHIAIRIVTGGNTTHLFFLLQKNAYFSINLYTRFQNQQQQLRQAITVLNFLHSIPFHLHYTDIFTNSGTPPYNHDINTATSLFWPEQKLSQSFSFLMNSFNTATSMIQSCRFLLHW